MRCLLFLYLSFTLWCYGCKTRSIATKSNTTTPVSVALGFQSKKFTAVQVREWVARLPGDTVWLDGFVGKLNMHHQEGDEIIVGIVFEKQRNAVLTLSYFTRTNAIEGNITNPYSEEAYEIYQVPDGYSFKYKPKGEIIQE